VVQCEGPDFKVSDQSGTKAFSPPECVKGGSYHPKPVDIWSFGMSIYCLMFTKLPFSHDNFDEEILSKPIEIPACSPDLRLLLERCLERDAAKRATITEICEMPWMQ
jgi:serine/threonine protein kinase